MRLRALRGAAAFGAVSAGAFSPCFFAVPRARGAGTAEFEALCAFDFGAGFAFVGAASALARVVPARPVATFARDFDAALASERLPAGPPADFAIGFDEADFACAFFAGGLFAFTPFA